jgi:hypothetical protein
VDRSLKIPDRYMLKTWLLKFHLLLTKQAKAITFFSNHLKKQKRIDTHALDYFLADYHYNSCAGCSHGLSNRGHKGHLAYSHPGRYFR